MSSGTARRAPVGDLDRAQPVDLAEPGHRLPAALEEAGIEVAGVDGAEPPGEGARHAADAAADLDQRPIGRRRRLQPELLEVHRYLSSPVATNSASVSVSPVSLLNTHPVAWTTSSALAWRSVTRPATFQGMSWERRRIWQVCQRGSVAANSTLAEVPD